ncbi:hypothetical protein T484DRAFT_1754946 [Baffinella frigidus]|nr:hypothetical protein T484DRAFT_1754946 [Cryptophyta sp. CCMP2293]
MAHSSIGNMTNTLIETGARHMQQCRTNFDVLKAFAVGEENLIHQSDKWCMAKDELVVSCNNNISPNAPKTATKYAYPSVITCMGTLDENEKSLMGAHYHFLGRYADKAMCEIAFTDKTTSDCEPVKISPKADQFRHFMPVGYSVGRAEAHGHKGDTVASVQIGGLRTVLNGGFEVQTGDLIQMYIPDVETIFFKPDGGRRHIDDYNKDAILAHGANQPRLTKLDQQRRDFYGRGNGMVKGQAERSKTGLFSIKPYMESLNEGGHQYYGDKSRVFARALSSARPYEPVDIMIARQSL